MFRIENWTKWLPTLTIVIIITGDIYFFSYYGRFGINIFEFVSASEIVTIFSQDLGIICLIGLLFICFPTLFFIASSLFLSEKLFGTKGRFARIKIKLIFKKYIAKLTIQIFFLLILVYSFLFKINDESLAAITLRLFILLFIVLVILSLTFNLLLRERKKKIVVQIIKTFTLALLVPFYVIIVFTMGEFKAQKLITSQQKWQYTYTLKDTLLVTNDSLKLLGTSNNNIFFYNYHNKTKSVLIYPKAALLNIHLKEIKDR